MVVQLYVARVRKGPTEVIDYTYNWWDNVLEPINDPIVDCTCSIDGDGAMFVSSSQFTTKDTTIWLSGGTPGLSYAASFDITTAAGRKMRRSIAVTCVLR